MRLLAHNVYPQILNMPELKMAWLLSLGIVYLVFADKVLCSAVNCITGSGMLFPNWILVIRLEELNSQIAVCLYLSPILVTCWESSNRLRVH